MNCLNKGYIIKCITKPIPIWIGFVINAVSWVIFALTSVHFVEFMMGMACLYVALLGITKNQEKGAHTLITWSIMAALWMFYWAFADPLN